MNMLDKVVFPDCSKLAGKEVDSVLVISDCDGIGWHRTLITHVT